MYITHDIYAHIYTYTYIVCEMVCVCVFGLVYSNQLTHVFQNRKEGRWKLPGIRAI